MIEIKKEFKRIKINLKAIKMGEDLCVILTGGDKPHLGALTIGSSLVNLNTFTFQVFGKICGMLWYTFR